jgi:transposase
VRLLASQVVRPYRKNPQNAGHDADALCEAVSRPDRRFVPAKAVAQQAVFMAHRAGARLVGARPALATPMRGLLAASGLGVPRGMARLRRVLPAGLADAASGLPERARDVIAA